MSQPLTEETTAMSQPLTEETTTTKKILIIVAGTEGDVRPATALASELERHHGAEVGVLTHTDCELAVQSAGAAFFDLGTSLSTARAHTEAGRALTAANAFNSMSRARAFMQPLVKEYAEKTSIAMEVFKPDYVVFSSLTLWTSYNAVKEAMGEVEHAKRMCVLHYMPMVPSAELYPCVGFSKVLPVRVSFICKATWSAACSAGWSLYRDPVQEALGKVAQNPADVQMQLPQILAYSPAVFTFRPGDWPENVRVVGYLSKEEPDPEVDETLEAFVAKDRGSESAKPLVFMSLGSMMSTVFSAERVQIILKAFINAASVADVRAVIQAPGMSGLAGCSMVPDDPALVPKDVFLTEKPLPHRWLFPKCKAVLCHGGAGTVHTALTMGCPVLVVPCETASDQPFWGRTITDAQIGRCVMRADQIKTGRRLGATLGEMVRDKTMKSKAEAVSDQIQNEQGLTKAADVIVTLVTGAEVEPVVEAPEDNTFQIEMPR